MATAILTWLLGVMGKPTGYTKMTEDCWRPAPCGHHIRLALQKVWLRLTWMVMAILIWQLETISPSNPTAYIATPLMAASIMHATYSCKSHARLHLIARPSTHRRMCGRKVSYPSLIPL